MHTQHQTELQQIQLTIEEAQAKIKRGEMLAELEKHPAFKELILDGYLRDRAVELAKGTAKASLNDIGAKVHHNALVGIASLNDYFHYIFTQAAAAHDAMYAQQQELELAEVEDHE